MITNIKETVNMMDERMAYEVYLQLKERFEVKVDCKMFANCNYVGDCQRKSSE